MRIGGSSWDYYRIAAARNTDEEILKNFVYPEANIVELMCHDKEHLDMELDPLLVKEKFVSCSLHLPVHTYRDDDSSHKILKKIEALCSRFAIQNIVIHPDTVVDRSLFQQYQHLPFSIENMDERKKIWRSVEDVKKILDENPHISFTLDLQHCYVNDPTMQLAKDFHEALWDKLVQYHISWYHPEYLHYPLFKTNQDIIISSLQRTDLPIIIESTFDEPGELEKEMAYIKKVIASNETQ